MCFSGLFKSSSVTNIFFFKSCKRFMFSGTQKKLLKRTMRMRRSKIKKMKRKNMSMEMRMLRKKKTKRNQTLAKM